MKGSPPFKRTTLFPAFARSASRVLMDSWGKVCFSRCLPHKFFPNPCVPNRESLAKPDGHRQPHQLAASIVGTESQQVRSSWACSNQIDFAKANTVFCLIRVLLQLSFGFCFFSREDQFSNRTLKDIFPENSALSGFFNVLFNDSSKFFCKACQLPIGGGIMLSILALSNRAKTGAAPPDDTAAMMGERSIMAGK